MCVCVCSVHSPLSPPSIVYGGMVAGSNYLDSGSGANPLCLPTYGLLEPQSRMPVSTTVDSSKLEEASFKIPFILIFFL